MKAAGVARRALDAAYLAGGMLAALCLLLMLIVVVAQAAARWLGFVLPGATNVAGYAMAAASFFAFAYALNAGAHIRVNLLLSRLGKRRRWGEAWCFAAGGALASYLAWHAVKTVYWSYRLNDISQGQDAVALWIPQSAAAAGAVLLAVACWDNLLGVLFGVKRPAAESAFAG